MGRLLLFASTSLRRIHSGNWDPKNHDGGEIGVASGIRTCGRNTCNSKSTVDGSGRFFRCEAQKSHFFLCKEVDSGDSHSPLQTIHPAILTWTVEIMVLKLMFLSNYWGWLVSMLVFWVFLYTFLQGSWLG